MYDTRLRFYLTQNFRRDRESQYLFLRDRDENHFLMKTRPRRASSWTTTAMVASRSVNWAFIDYNKTATKLRTTTKILATTTATTKQNNWVVIFVSPIMDLRSVQRWLITETWPFALAEQFLEIFWYFWVSLPQFFCQKSCLCPFLRVVPLLLFFMHRIGRMQ